jgi:hypothetical protein
MACLDGDRAIRELEAVVERLDPRRENASLDDVRAYFAALAAEDSGRSFIVGGVLTSIEAYQVVADALGPALGLEHHAFQDVRRFALRPTFEITDVEPTRSD